MFYLSVKFKKKISLLKKTFLFIHLHKIINSFFVKTYLINFPNSNPLLLLLLSPYFTIKIEILAIYSCACLFSILPSPALGCHWLEVDCSWLSIIDLLQAIKKRVGRGVAVDFLSLDTLYYVKMKQ